MPSYGTLFRGIRSLILLALVALLVACWLLHDHRLAIDQYTITIGSQQRTYVLALPKTDSQKPLPLVFAFHGAGGGPEGMVRGSQFDEIAAQHELIAVYPAAVRGLWAVPGTAPPERMKADLEFVEQMIEQISQSHAVDRQRIYAIGMSHGASFAQYLASERSELLAAVAAHSHPPPAAIWESEPARRVPLMLIIGADDQQATAASVEQAAAAYTARGHDVELIVLPEWGHRWDCRLNKRIVRFLLSHRLSGAGYSTAIQAAGAQPLSPSS